MTGSSNSSAGEVGGNEMCLLFKATVRAGVVGALFANFLTSAVLFATGVPRSGCLISKLDDNRVWTYQNYDFRKQAGY